jgi:hypothetical protein
MEVNEMRINTKITDTYDELIHLKNQGKLSVGGLHELAVCEWVLFGRK